MSSYEGWNGSASSGFIEDRIRNWRKRLNPGDKAVFGIRSCKTKASDDYNKKIMIKRSGQNIKINQDVLQTMQQWLKENST